MKSLLLLALLACTTALTTAAEPWGHSPEATDDRFSNPAKPLYAGPYGWWNRGEVRAQLNDSAQTSYAYKGAFKLVRNEFISVGGPDQLQVILFDFADIGVPQPGEYRVTSQGSLKNKTVRISFADTAGGKIREWIPADNAGVLTVKLMHGFLYFTCRHLALQSNHTIIGGAHTPKTIMTFGFEGAMSPSEVESYEME